MAPISSLRYLHFFGWKSGCWPSSDLWCRSCQREITLTLGLKLAATIFLYNIKLIGIKWEILSPQLIQHSPCKALTLFAHSFNTATTSLSNWTSILSILLTPCHHLKEIRHILYKEIYSYLWRWSRMMRPNLWWPTHIRSKVPLRLKAKRVHLYKRINSQIK